MDLQKKSFIEPAENLLENYMKITPLKELGHLVI